jgi:hypothetical protein
LKGKTRKSTKVKFYSYGVTKIFPEGDGSTYSWMRVNGRSFIRRKKEEMKNVMTSPAILCCNKIGPQKGWGEEY